jgi:hypothetical protein
MAIIPAAWEALVGQLRSEGSPRLLLQLINYALVLLSITQKTLFFPGCAANPVYWRRASASEMNVCFGVGRMHSTKGPTDLPLP